MLCGRCIFTDRIFCNVFFFSGILLEKITSDMQKKNSSKLSSKMFMYSTREKSIFNLLHILNRDKIFKPDYSTSLIIELHVIKQQPVVQV